MINHYVYTNLSKSVSNSTIIRNKVYSGILKTYQKRLLFQIRAANDEQDYIINLISFTSLKP